MSKPIKLEMNKDNPIFENQIILTDEDRVLLERIFNYCMRTSYSAEYARLVILKNKLLSK